jgi:hypothetical protein
MQDLTDYFIAKHQVFNNNIKKILYATSWLGPKVKNAWRDRHPKGYKPSYEEFKAFLWNYIKLHGD